MTLRIIGAGVGRTGTHSLKLALERLLGAPCYHMVEVFGRPEHVPMWHAAIRDEPVDWPTLFEGYAATVDWPGGGVWDQILDAYPDAMVLLSTRRSSDEWYGSAKNTIFDLVATPPPGMEAWHAMGTDMFRRLSPDVTDEAMTKAAYERHNERVRAEVPPEQLIDWQPHDGWGPLCEGLGVPVPDEPFPVTNTTSEFRAMTGREPL